MLEELLNANQEFLAKRMHQEHSRGNPRRHLAVVTCMSAHLVDFIHHALGLQRGDALFIQNAGNTITPYDNSIIRSLAVGIYLLDIKEVAVIGHTGCGMKTDVSKVTDALNKYGKSRETFKDYDIREWFGLTATEEVNIRKVVDAIKNSPYIPHEIPIYGLMIDNDGELTEVYHYQQDAYKTVVPVLGEVTLPPISEPMWKPTLLQEEKKPVSAPKIEVPKRVIANETKFSSELFRPDIRKDEKKETKKDPVKDEYSIKMKQAGLKPNQLGQARKDELDKFRKKLFE